ncbi:MAG: HAMP domain-containing sensor histidine kinase [Myxococcota bacterium]|nr:HAMP domain-containing sensor histidine kinase [Myxococcota bacterium]
MRRRSIGLPLALGITLVVIALALGVGWQLLVVGDLGPVGRGLRGIHWTLIILGSVFFVLIVVGLLLLCIWLVREIRLNQRQQAFLDAVTHEMKTPLAALRLYLETLRRHDPAPERRLAFLSRMEEDVERLETTVTQVLAAARAETWRRPRAPRETLDLTGLLHREVEALRERHDLSGEAVRIDRHRPLHARGDAEELGVVFRNLLDNAVKYSSPPVEIRVSLVPREDGRVAVEIADRGIGIEPRELRKIFQRFYRAGRDVQRQASGLGLGLFIVGHLVRRNGGRVFARSEGSGRGSRFTVVLRGAGETAPAALGGTEPRTAGQGGL